MVAFELCFSVLEKNISGEIAFVSISLFQLQIKEPAIRSTTMRAFVFLGKFVELYYHKIFETRS